MKFMYGDVVEVNSGFYKGQKGIVYRCEPITSFFGFLYTYEYQVELEDDSLLLLEEELTLIRREQENNNGTH